MKLLHGNKVSTHHQHVGDHERLKVVFLFFFVDSENENVSNGTEFGCKLLRISCLTRDDSFPLNRLTKFRFLCETPTC